MEEAYAQFVLAAEAKDCDAMVRLIRTHPELRSWDGGDGYLTEVIFRNCPELLPNAFAAGLHPDDGPASQHQTLLQLAVCDSNLWLVKLCLDHGANVERRNCENETALGYAAASASLETVQLLVESGADVNAIEGTQETFLSTALDAAYSTNPEYRPDILVYLREHGAKHFRELPPTS